MMTAQHQSADQVKPYAYPHGTPAVDVVRSSSTGFRADPNADMSDESVNACSISAASPLTADRKRKQPASPTEGADTDGMTNTQDKEKELRQPSKKYRRELPPHTVAILKGWMLSREHVKHPYPTDEDKQMLLKKTGISMKQLTNWFTNARKRIWKPMMRREHSRQMQSAIDFEHTEVREFPGAGLSQQYDESSYAPRPVVRHSFDAGGLGAPPHVAAATFNRYLQPQVIPANAPMYPTRAVRSMSDAPTTTDVDDYIDAERIRERVLESCHDGDGTRNNLSPRALKILQEWGNANSRRDFPYPNDSERSQLARETGLDVAQVDWWVTNLRKQIGDTNVRPTSIPSASNMEYPPAPVYGKRRSIPTTGNPMFPPPSRPMNSSSLRPSIPSAGNPQFPPPPARREWNDRQFAALPPTASHYSGHEMSRVRSMTVSSGPYLPPPPLSSSAGKGSQVQNTTGALPSLSSRNLLNRAPIVFSHGPTMGQPRDSRSRTLDMGQFADARRRKMTFQDILASTAEPRGNAALAAVPLMQSTGHSVANSDLKNFYPNSGESSTASYQVAGSIGFQPKRPQLSSEKLSGRII
ncbi:hypothetical protein PsorP6_002698 [Peronosclerospora sorghi]|uniref:Uncharacterized protein n=1 Tax=Peronosclerospora sorghi TaxID=230839 RepID=A0ACC0WR24_9STRA|nr:hypothetical protein PsorP6_019351 [Peronosclerospora sorghi]KAI9921309.1 hypothetical protein PsorP6_002698 [Peronosclerospora sorghi]